MLQCFYHPDYFLPLPEGHPFPMEKFPEARALLGDSVEVLEPPLLSREDLERVHLSDYLDSVDFDAEDGVGGLKRYDRHRLGLPAHARLLQRSCLESSGTAAAAKAAWGRGIAANLAGGTHHAFPDQGLGYCVLNDVAIAIKRSQRSYSERTCLVVDTDAHQGDGTHFIFQNHSSVFTYSIHVGRNYPSNKQPGDLDVPLDRYVGDADYLQALADTLPQAFERTEPDLVFWISGADNHENDRFGQMKLTLGGMAERDRQVLTLCRESEAATVVLYGGGYNRAKGMTAQLHAQTIKIANEFANRSPVRSGCA